MVRVYIRSSLFGRFSKKVKVRTGFGGSWKKGTPSSRNLEHSGITYLSTTTLFQLGIKNLKLKDRTNVEDSVMFLIQIQLQTYCQDKYCPDNLNCHENVLPQDFISREFRSLLRKFYPLYWFWENKKVDNGIWTGQKLLTVKYPVWKWQSILFEYPKVRV